MLDEELEDVQQPQRPSLLDSIRKELLVSNGSVAPEENIPKPALDDNETEGVENQEVGASLEVRPQTPVQAGQPEKAPNMPPGVGLPKNPVVPSPKSILSLQAVSKTYPGGQEALHNVSLDIPPGDFLFLVGSSGAGKSTLLRLLIQEEQATTGKVFLKGEDVTKSWNRKRALLRRNFGIVFQDFKLLPKSTVAENIRFALIVTRPGEPDMSGKVQRALDRVGLRGKGDKFPAELSGGEQQRVAIARALVTEPPIVVADEPTGNLDPDSSWQIMDLLTKINATGTTVVMATHNKEIVDRLKRRVVVIKGGQISRDEQYSGYRRARS